MTVDGKHFTVYNPADLKLEKGGSTGLSTLQGDKLPTVSCRTAGELVHKGASPFISCAKVSDTSASPTFNDGGKTDLVLTELMCFNPCLLNTPPFPPRSIGSELKKGKPVCNHGFSLTYKDKEQMEVQIKHHLDKGWITPSRSPYNAAVLFIQKKDGSLRMRVDHRGLHNNIVKDRSPLPGIDDLIDTYIVFSSLDLQNEHHQIRIPEEDAHKTAFTTHKGLLEYRVMPFESCNAPAAFQRLMDKMFGHLPFVVAYLEHILVFSKSEEGHRSHIELILSIL